MNDRVAIIPEAVLQSIAWTSLTGRAKAVLIALWLNAGKDRRCWPSKETLGYWAGGVSRSSVTRAIGELERAGLIQRLRTSGGRADNGRGVTGLYELITPTGAALRPLPSENGRNLAPVEGVQSCAEGVQSCTEGVQYCTKKGCTGEPQNNTGNNKENSARRKRADLWETARQCMSLGSDLDCDRFRQAWADWCDHQRQLGKRAALTSQAIKRQIADLERMGVDRATAAIEHSIGKGWQGIYEPDRRQQPAQQTSAGGYSSPGELFEAVQAGRVYWARSNKSGWIDLSQATGYSESGLKANGQTILKASDIPRSEIQ
jgi:DNA-binding MarR family transcriptional regulator